MLRPQSIHRPPSTLHRRNGNYPPSTESVPNQKFFLSVDCPPGGFFFHWSGDTLQWMVENPTSLGGQWTLDGGLIGDTLGGKF